MTRKKPKSRNRGRRPARRRPERAVRRKRGSPVGVAAVAAGELDALRAQVAELAERSGPPRWNADPADVRRSVLKLVLTLVELIRQLLERQAIRRMDAGTLTADETEAVGLALMRLQETIRDLSAQFDIAPDDLNLDLGPIGRLM